MWFQGGLDIFGLIPCTGREYEAVSLDRPGVLPKERVVVERIRDEVVHESTVFVGCCQFLAVFLANRVYANATCDVLSDRTRESCVYGYRRAIDEYEVEVGISVDACLRLVVGYSSDRVFAVCGDGFFDERLSRRLGVCVVGEHCESVTPGVIRAQVAVIQGMHPQVFGYLCGREVFVAVLHQCG